MSTSLKLFRFTFIHGDYDVGQAVVLASSLDEAYVKLEAACIANPDQGYPTRRYSETDIDHPWLMSTVVRERRDGDARGEEPTEIEGDVVFTHGVDG